MEKRQDPTQVHCYTNPSFCRQSEYIPEDSHSDSNDLPPPPQFQVDDLPPPPAVHQPQPQYGQTNPAFHGSPEVDLTSHHPHPHQQHQQQQPPPHHRSVVNLNRPSVDRYCYIDDNTDDPAPLPISHKRCGSLPLGGPDRRAFAYRTNRYEYIHDDATVQIQLQQQQQQVAAVTANASRYEFIEQQQVQQRSAPTPQQQQQLIPTGQNSVRASVRSYRSADAHYTTLGPDGVESHDRQWNEEDGQGWNSSRRQINTPRGRYTSVPMQDEDPPSLPERNGHEPVSSGTSTGQRVNNLATQKLHEILATPRKPRSRSQSDALSPIKSPSQQQPMLHGLGQRSGFTPGCSPSSAAGHRAMNSPIHPQQQPPPQPHHPQQQQHHPQQQHQSTPQSRGTLSPRSKGPTTSTPNKDPPSARRCLPLNEGPMVRRHIEDSQAAAMYGRTQSGQQQRYHPDEDVATAAAVYAAEHHRKKAAQADAGFYQSVESAFIARTAVVPPLSPPMSDANTTLVSGTEKSDRKNAPIILALVGILTCGLAIYLSWTQGRRYYFDSAIGCGACCALAGACRSMRRTWTGLGLAGLAALSCAGLLLLAAKSPRPGTPMHDVTAGALCGVSLLGAVLALLALLSPRCTFGRHHRVHSWIPRFSP